jgi:HK97 family phage major capsid protein
MAVNMSTSGNLQNMSRIMLAQARYTEEHNAPMVGLIEKFNLGKGEYKLEIPKVAQMSAEDLSEGQDMIDSEDLDVSTITATTAEVGLKVIVTDTLLRQNNEDVYKIIGKQMGDAMARKKDTDIIALFPTLNGGTVLGANDKNLNLANASAIIANAKADRFGSDVFVVHHPNALWKHVVNLPVA